ncbi:hypothetical protein TraAM80_02590 [Trypanosoma rangeli]|uniref:Translin-associated factor X-interacting protein 1 N-terminal domain-containing protein n=1 Tax=Trypanosoma rangeli TaxID=5698 RepID=A0A422NTD8_TRYRA|nr:uncharacterized protein TraAM80_02590 [Trypanosoma rangeli]RNF08747.1 hypothetical protein TraAM80_02590 [Trypanosoma rangeli]|eukprot:RNF08747.1 hypothetical protein TraAM80_02590 [Trypanosoma rangeli]
MGPKFIETEVEFGKRLHGSRKHAAGSGEAGEARKVARLLPLSVVPRSAALKALQPRELPPLALGPYPQLSVWPSKHKRSVGGSYPPLALQLEAFIRKEQQLYLHEHRDCTHADTLHIVREAFSVLIEHFMEYRRVLSFIREEYESTIDEATSELRRLRARNLENESERSFHTMELMRQREGLTTVISNQQAQLQATQGLIHSLRDQVAMLEKSNSDLSAEVKATKKMFDESMMTSKLLKDAMVEETARNAQLINLHKSDEREVGRLNAQINLLREKLDEADKRIHTLVRQVMFSLGTTKYKKLDESIASERGFSSTSLANSEKDTDQSVVALQRRIDDLLLAYEQLKQQKTEAKKSFKGEGDKHLKGEASPVFHEESGVAVAATVDTSSKLIQSWLQEENLTAQEVDKLDFLLPPGNWEDDPLSFLKVCHPVRNLRMTREVVVSALREFWSLRQLQFHVPLKSFFMEWLHKKVGPGKAAEEIGLNLLSVCQRNLDDPECRAMLLVLRSFLPEDVVLSWQKDIKELEGACQDSPHLVDGTIETAFIENALRIVMPEKSYVHMLELRLYLWRLSEGSGRVPIDVLFNESGHFAHMLRRQFLYEVEEFTLQVVESIRLLSKDSTTVRLHDITETISKLDGGIPKGTLHRLVAEATQLTAIDVVKADADFRVKLQTVLHRFRSAVLLRRATPCLGDDSALDQEEDKSVRDEDEDADEEDKEGDGDEGGKGAACPPPSHLSSLQTSIELPSTPLS